MNDPSALTCTYDSADVIRAMHDRDADSAIKIARRYPGRKNLGQLLVATASLAADIAEKLVEGTDKTVDDLMDSIQATVETRRRT